MIIQCTDLRIGNLVYDIAGINPVEVEILMKDKIPLIQPIPLTKDWILKFGFVIFDWPEFKDSRFIDYLHLTDGGVILRVIPEGASVFTLDHCSDGYSFIAKVQYVHQFQNLYFALTGEEVQLLNHTNVV